MGRRGRAAGRSAVIEREVRKALDATFAASVSRANTGTQPRRFPLAEAINMATGAGMADWMPRDPRDDVDFGPSNALMPARIDPVRPDTGRPEPRLNEYPVAWNLPGAENVPIPWATLRAAADNVDIMRRCIEIRKEQLAGLDWSITLDDQVVQGMFAASDGSQGRSDIESELRRKLLPEIQRLTAMWRAPWAANGVSFEQWCAAVMEDHLVADGVAIYPRVTYGGDVTAFELIDPTTIKLLIDYRGARPAAPYPAFQQVLYGFPRAEFAACAREVTGEDGRVYEEIEPGMTADQLYYFRENFRTFTPYGFSAVAQALISARLYLKRQGWMLAEYDDGSTPLTWLVPDGSDGNLVEKLNYRTRRQWEDSINDELTGQTRARHRIKVGMPGYTPVQMTSVDERYKSEYDIHLITMLAQHFGVTKAGLGFTETSGFGNSGLHEGQADVQDKASTKPDTRMIERIVNDLSRKFLGMPPELRFKFVHQDAEDGEAEDTAADSQRARGTLTLNDDRRRLGLSPFTFAEADMPLVKMGDAWAPIEGMAERAQQQAEAEQALVDDQLANSEAARQADAAAAGSEEDVEKSLELVALARWRKRGGARRRAFICKALEPHDFRDGVPADVEFAWYEWVPDGLPDSATEDDIIGVLSYDLDKAFGKGNDNWRTLARDHRGRWVARGSMRVDALGPQRPEGNVLSSLRADAERRRGGGTRRGATGSTARDLSGVSEKELLGMSRRGEPGARDEVRRRREAGTLAHVDRKPDRTWEEEAQWSDRQLPAKSSSSTVDGMTSPTEDKVPSRLERQRALSAGVASAMGGGAPAPGSMAERIQRRQDEAARAAYAELTAANGGNPVELTALRAKLQSEHGLDRGQQDIVLARLAGQPDVAFFPEENQKLLADEAYRDAALMVGGEPKHLLHIDKPRDVPAQTEAEATARADAAQKRYEDAQDAAYVADDAAHAAGREDDALNAAVVTAQAEADRLRAEADAAEADLNDRFIRPRTAAEREAKNARMSAAVEAANAKRDADERQRRAEYQRRLAEEAMSRERREAERARIREQITAATPGVYARMLDGDSPLITHDASRKIVAAMREQGWTATDQIGTVSTWEAPDGRRIGLALGKGGKLNFVERRDGEGHGALTQKDAAALVKGAPSTPEPPAAPITASVSGTERFSGPRGRTEMKARLRELSSMTRAQFDALPDDVKARITADLAHIGAQEDWTESIRSSRFSGSRGASGVPMEARSIRARLTAALPAPVDNSPAGIAERVRSAPNASQARTATHGMSKDQLIDVARELGVPYSRSWKVDKFRDKIAEKYGSTAADQQRAQGVNDAMNAAALASLSSSSTFGGAHGTVGVSGIKPGARIMLRNQVPVEVLESPRRARPDSQGRTGWVFRVRNESNGIPGTMRINDDEQVALAPPKGGASRPKAEASAAVALRGDAALAAAPLSVEGDGARKIDRPGAAALERYRGKAFTGINRELRSGGTSAANAKTVEQIDRVMGESKLTDDVEVYRGIGNVEALFGDAARRKLVGHEWTDAAPQSTTTEADIADRFLAMGGSRRDAAIIKMRVPAGTGAIEMSDARYEAELLLQRGLRMRVVSDTGPWRRGQKKPRTIEVEVIPA